MARFCLSSPPKMRSSLIILIMSLQRTSRMNPLLQSPLRIQSSSSLKSWIFRSLRMTWGSLIPPRLKAFWVESGSAQILKECFGVLKRNLWTLMSLTALNSATRFLLVWTLYKTVCVIAVYLFGVPAGSIPQEMIPTSSSLGDPDGKPLSPRTLIV